MFEDINVDSLRALHHAGELTIIDVRSPSEYKDATIPGSINIPFFNDEERAEVGTLYKQISPEAAKEKGLEIISAKLPAFIQEFSGIPGAKAVFCWRGGMRSKTSATVLDLMGIKVKRLVGGYRSYRNWVASTLDASNWKHEAFVLNGYTGSGKTRILQNLKNAGYPVLDLEGMANHRGSIFGQIGLDPYNQKTFDALFVEEMDLLHDAPYVLFEGESKRIGKVLLPTALLEKKEQATQLILHMPIEVRVQQILEDYQPWEQKQACIAAFKRIKKRIHTPVASQIEADLNTEQYASAVRLLLEYYYDPLYDHLVDQIPSKKKVSLTANSIEEGTSLVTDYLATKNIAQHRLQA
ncbi:tRNA 2-selenouridine(34) synthase MnmH [Oceanobacillus sp. M65]|uniref:tRNA 2-selenouridine(34) synthase MnmH n=1 Tax=Oceanobacillus sp. M65 TaxID=3457435 RepID=UPI003FCEC258